MDIVPENSEPIEKPIEKNTDNGLSTITHDEIPDIMDNLLTRIGKTNKSLVSGRLNHNNVDIDLREIKEFLNKGTITNYTFALDVKGSPYHIYNLVMSKNAKGNILEPFIIGYKMKPKDMEAFFKSGEDYHNFIADYKYYKLEKFFEDSKFNVAGKSGDCG